VVSDLLVQMPQLRQHYTVTAARNRRMCEATSRSDYFAHPQQRLHQALDLRSITRRMCRCLQQLDACRTQALLG
jgi:hypothetical protein